MGDTYVHHCHRLYPRHHHHHPHHQVSEVSPPLTHLLTLTATDADQPGPFSTVEYSVLQVLYLQDCTVRAVLYSTCSTVQYLHNGTVPAVWY